MSDLRKAVEQALEALDMARIEFDYHGNPLDSSDAAVLFAAATLRQALEAEQETTPKKGSYEAVFGHLGMTPDELGNYMITLQMLAEAIVTNNVAARKQDEPVAYVVPTSSVAHDGSREDVPDYLEWADEASDYEKRIGYPLYTHPQQQLTEELLHSLWLHTPVDYYTDNESIFKQAARAIEHAHNIK